MCVCKNQILRSLPPQREFIQFCKSLYGMFHGDPEENDLFQAIAKVTSLVLQIGEASHHQQQQHANGATEASQAPEGGAPSSGGCTGKGDGSLASDADWTVSYAQILASLLTEPALVNFFEKSLDLVAKIAEAREKQYHQRAGLLTIQQGAR